MKNLFTKHISFLRLLTAGCFLVPSMLHAQTYYSQFTAPVSGYNYAISNPSSGEGCTATPIVNGIGVADNQGANDLDNTYASFSAIQLTSPYTCTDNYKFNVNLNLPADVPSLPAGTDVGFKIRVPTGISPDSLGKYIVIGSYLVNADHTSATFQEYRTGNALQGLDQGQDGITWRIHFTSTLPLNDLELSVDPKIIQLNTNFEFDVFYAYGASPSVTLPAQIANIKATVAGKNVNLSWQSLTETNVKGYRIERSSNGGASYTAIATVVSKSNSNSVINYSYNDNNVVDGKYLYRVVVLDRSGSFKNSNAVAASISGQGKLLLYPTVVRAGQNITVKTSETGDVTVHIFDATGRLVKQQRVTSGGQFNIATTGLTNGVYTVKLVTQSGNISQSRIVVN